MVVILQPLFIFLIIVNIPICRTFMKEDLRRLNNIFEAAKSFNSLYKIKSWIIHYDDSTLKYALRALFKEKKNNFGYIRLNYLPFQRNISRCQQRSSHLYIVEKYEYLRRLFYKPGNTTNDQPTIGEFPLVGQEIWLIFATQTSRRQRSSLIAILKSSLIRFDSCIFAFYKDDGENYQDKFHIFDEYKINEISDQIISAKYGEWDPEDGLTLYEENIWKRRSNLKGHQFRVSSDVWPQSQTVVENDCTSSKCFKGQYPDVFYAIQSIMNFTFKVQRNPVAGAKLADGSWNGQIGMVLNGAVDFAIDSFGITKERMDVVDYLIFAKGGMGRIYIRNPKDGRDWKVYIKPLRQEAWIGIILFCIITPILMMVVLLGRKSEYSHRTFACILSEVCLTLYKSMIRLDANLKLYVVSKRISHYSVVVGGMLLFWLWEAQLINYFTFPLNKLPFNNLDEFLSESNKKLIVLRGSMHEDHFRHSTQPTIKTVWNERIEPFIQDDIYTKSGCPVLNHIVEDDSYAGYMMLTSESGSMPSCEKWVNCEVVIIPHVIHKTLGSGWIFPKNSPFLPIFKHYVNNIKEGAILNWIYASYSERKGPDQICPAYDGQSIGMEKAFSLFGIISFGLGLSIILFILECIISGKRRAYLQTRIDNKIQKAVMKIKKSQK